MKILELGTRVSVDGKRTGVIEAHYVAHTPVRGELSLYYVVVLSVGIWSEGRTEFLSSMCAHADNVKEIP